MQRRMLQHQLTTVQTSQVLERVETGAIATVDSNGNPYVVPVHYVFLENCIYIHGLPAGEKVENIQKNGQVSFTAWDMQGYLLDEEGKPCDTNTKYQSVIVKGNAKMVADMEVKKKALHAIVGKYTPQLVGKELPMPMVQNTGVIEIQIVEMTGKYYE